MRSTIIVLSFLVSLIPTVTYAQTPSDAGALHQQIEKERTTEFSPPKNVRVPKKKVDKRAEEEKNILLVMVEEFRFEGNTLFSNEALDTIVKPYTDRLVSFHELENAAAAIGELYRNEGLVVRSFLPEQDIIDGVVTIQIIESKFGKTIIEGDTEIKLPAGMIEKIVAAQQPSGKYLNTQKLDRALLLINDLPGVVTSGRLKEGEIAGKTDLVIRQTKQNPLTKTVMIDNQGSRSTGSARMHGFARFMSPFGKGDQASLYAIAAEGLGFLRIEQTFPIGYNGWRVGANTSVMRYKLVPDEFKALDGKGGSAYIGLQTSFPIIRSREKNLFISGNYDHRYFKNETQGVTSSDYRINALTAAFNGNMLDIFGIRGSSEASITATIGNLDLGTLDTSEVATLDGSYRKLSYRISHQKSISSTLTVHTKFSGQLSPDRELDSSEMFYLGGANGVRAYPISEGSGVSGNMLNLELYWRVAPNYQLMAFYDHGYVHNKGDVDSYSLDGAGIGLAWQSNAGFNINMTWSHRIGSNPNPTATGGDQDGSSLKNRLWLAVSKQF